MISLCGMGRVCVKLGSARIFCRQAARSPLLRPRRCLISIWSAGARLPLWRFACGAWHEKAAAGLPHSTDGANLHAALIDTVFARLVSFSGCRCYEAGSRIVPEGREAYNAEIAATRLDRW